MDQYIGKMLDNRYEILEQIGSGGMSNVYKAKCHRLNRLVAIKILKSELAEDADFRRRFRDESQAVAMLSHPNIVSVYDVSRDGDVEYIVMELIDGITLKQYMERRGLMDWRESLHFIIQIMRGLSHAHSRGIIHRDIKPQNIMVLRDGSVKVADFGIACLANAGQTLTQEALGSVHYISPEQARGDRTDARSDIYSAGVVLYEMLTGRLPFEGNSAVSVAIQHLSSVPLSPRDINEKVPEALELICMKAMNADAEKRYATANAMVEDLEKFRKDPSVNMDYIKTELEEPENNEPTQFIPSGAVNTAVKRAKKEKAERESLLDEETPEEKKKAKKKMMFIIGGFAAALLVVLLIFKVIMGGFSSTGSNSYEVPSVVGHTVEEANQMDGVKDVFTITVIGYRTDTKYQAGQIVEQDPAAGKIRKDNRVINVYVCSENVSTQMPSLAGYDSQEAKVLLKNMHLDLIVETSEQFSTDVAAGKVISTTPAANASIAKGDTIYMVVSKGPEKKSVTVPSFLDMDADSAAAKAKGLGLEVGSYKYEYNDKASGLVTGQSVSATSTVEEGTAIVFTVSKGPETAKPVSVTKTYTIPDKYKGTVTVTIMQGTTQVLEKSMNLDTDGRTVSCTFTGTSGTTTQVYVIINGNDTVQSETITFQ